MSRTEKYYLGLDIGTDSIGYAVADTDYKLLKYKQEPMWGVHVFEESQQSAERRGFRTARRRLDRRQQRVQLVREIFAKAIAEIDPKFYTRIDESALWPEDATGKVGVFFDTDFCDSDYHRMYPTIHHLITGLMDGTAKRDVRLVYLACAWLVAHRGHFLSEISKDNINALRDFHAVYNQLKEYLDSCLIDETNEVVWDAVNVSQVEQCIKMSAGVKVKSKALTAVLFPNQKVEKKPTLGFPFSREHIITLLCGGKCSVADLFGNPEYSELKSVSLSMKDEEFELLLQSLGDDAELLIKMKAVFDWALLQDVLRGKEYISVAKVEVYREHKNDLKNLKHLIRKYVPHQYDEMFRIVDKKVDNYAAYAGNFKSDISNKAGQHKVGKEAFYKCVKTALKAFSPDAEDKKMYDDILARMEIGTYMPKQVDSDNRVIPHQLYWVELKQILEQASQYLPFLNEADAEGYTAKEKILSVFEFRVPYYVGPLNKQSKQSWISRKDGKITPWNFDQMVDHDASEQAFIKRMTNTCTYLAGEPVLAKSSMLYEKFMVLNEINCITVNGRRISAEIKQKLYHELFEKKNRVTVNNIRVFLKQNGVMSDKDELGGIDITVKSSLNSAMIFRRLLQNNLLTKQDAEDIISRSTYTESKARFGRWIHTEFPWLSEEDKRYLIGQKFKDFGRLSYKLLCEIEGVNPNTGEVCSIMQALWETQYNFMELLSDRFPFAGAIRQHNADYYDHQPNKTLSERLDDMYVSNAVKRPIIRALDIVSDVVKATGRAPDKIFVEMARGSKEDDKGKRTQSRYQQLMELYSKIKHEDVRALSAQLEAMGELRDNRLQSEKLFLYFLQLGKCMYTGKPIDLDQLMNDKLYDVDHIWPRAKIKDDSILNNKVLVLSTVNGAKGDRYPIDSDIRTHMKPTWDFMLHHNLITQEKYNRLIRNKPFDADEEWGFINRQMVETRQSTKAVAEILGELYPQTEIVYVKAGLVSDFRHVYDLLKSRKVNDLHHAKDAYLNIVAGNVYHERFTKKWFMENRGNYSIKTTTLFGAPRYNGDKLIWNGAESLDVVKKTMQKNAVHYTRYAFCRKGGLFDQQPVKAAVGLVPLKKDLPTEKYGGYNKATASFFILVKYTNGKKQDVMIMPVELMVKDKFLSNAAFAEQYAVQTIESIIGKTPGKVSFPLGMRILKVNTMFSMDGYRMCLTGKSSGGAKILVSSMMPLALGHPWETYIKKIESLLEKKAKNPNMAYSPDFDKVTPEQNLELYRILTDKLKNSIYQKRPANPVDTLEKGMSKFEKKNIFEQCDCLMQMIGLFGRINSGFDLSAVGGAAKAGVSTMSSNLSNWKKTYTDVRIIDQSASGLYEKISKENLLELL